MVGVRKTVARVKRGAGGEKDEGVREIKRGERG